MEASEAGFTCAICLDDLPPPPARLPCCGSSSSTIQYCADCVAAVCRNGVGGVGRCPTCRAYFTVDSAGTITQCERQDVCAICRQGRLIVAEHRGHPLCDACHFGRAVPLRYECANCSAVQHIPHPMYRYQRTPHEFGTTSWACHRCGDFTMWRVAQADAARVPAADAPESWGRRDEWLAQVRAQRTARLRRGLPSLATWITHRLLALLFMFFCFSRWWSTRFDSSSGHGYLVLLLLSVGYWVYWDGRRMPGVPLV